MPVPIKDLTDVEGVLTTQGSPIYRDNVPARSDFWSNISKANGAMVYAKSNTPEFGAGANTFNEVFGATRNPWDTVALRRRLLGRRRGGACHRHGVARARLRHGRLVAQSRELLRHRRPAPEHRPRRAYAGRQDRSQSRRARPDGAQCRGPRAAARRHERRASGRSAVAAPLPVSFLSAARSGKRPKRVAYSPDLGITPVDPEVAAITRKAAARFAEAGADRRGSPSRPARGP